MKYAAFAIGAFLLAVVLIWSQARPLGGIDTNLLSGSVTNDGVSVLSASTQVVAFNSGRKYLLLANDSANPIYCAFGATAVVNKGLRLDPVGTSTSSGSSIFESYPAKGLFIQAVNCVAAVTSTINVIER